MRNRTPDKLHPDAAPERIGVIDIGTNSVKLLVAGPDLVPAHFERRTTRLGRGMTRSHRIRSKPLADTIATLQEFARAARRRGARDVFAFATWAMRGAAGAHKALATLEKQSGVPVRVLSGREEARFGYLSARAHLPRPRPWTLVCDVGGGSTELVLARSGKVVATTSKPLGALHLTERFIDTDPIDADQFAHLSRHVESTVRRWLNARPDIPASALDLVVSGGSVTTLAAMLSGSYPGENMVRLGPLRDLQRHCLGLTTEARKSIPGLAPDRADIIPAGIAVVLAIMEASGKRILRVNDGGVREGALIHLLGNNLEW